MSSMNSSFNMDYIGFGLGTSYTTKYNLFIDGSLNYIRHIDNTYNDVFFTGWDQLSSPSNGTFHSSNVLASIGVGYKLNHISARIGYERYLGKYEIMSLFGKEVSRNDFSFTIGYRI